MKKNEDKKISSCILVTSLASFQFSIQEWRNEVGNADGDQILGDLIVDTGAIE